MFTKNIDTHMLEREKEPNNTTGDEDSVKIELKRPAVFIIPVLLLLVAGILLIALWGPEVVSTFDEQAAYEYQFGQRESAKKVVKVLDITDACLSTGERYVRTPGTVDPSASIQIYPGAMSMYLSEAAVAPPDQETISNTFHKPKNGVMGVRP